MSIIRLFSTKPTSLSNAFGVAWNVRTLLAADKNMLKNVRSAIDMVDESRGKNCFIIDCHPADPVKLALYVQNLIPVLTPMGFTSWQIEDYLRGTFRPSMDDQTNRYIFKDSMKLLGITNPGQLLYFTDKESQSMNTNFLKVRTYSSGHPVHSDLEPLLADIAKLDLRPEQEKGSCRSFR